MFEIIGAVVLSLLAAAILSLVFPGLFRRPTHPADDDPPTPKPEAKPAPPPVPPPAPPPVHWPPLPPAPPVYKPRVWHSPTPPVPWSPPTTTPSKNTGKKPWESEYTEDWSKVSREYRKSKRWICEGCGVNLTSHRRLLHTHHQSMDKSDNSPSNLRAYCVVCHSEQPHHDKLRVSIRLNGEYDQIVYLRHNQGIR